MAKPKPRPPELQAASIIGNALQLLETVRFFLEAASYQLTEEPRRRKKGGK